jgi:hypothetical protein
MKCSGMSYPTMNPYPCSAQACVMRGNKWFCRCHDPVYSKKRKELAKEMAAEYESQRQQRQRQEAWSYEI